MNKKVTLHGIPITIVSDDDAEDCEYLVCMPAGYPSKFTDNFKGFCCRCGCEVIYRWYAPRKPKRICVACMSKEHG